MYYRSNSMDPTNLAADVVLLPVPLQHATLVATYRDDLISGRAMSAPDTLTGDTMTVVVPGQGSWTQPMVARLLDQLPYDGVLALFDMCADRAGQWVPKADAEQAHDIAPVQLRNELGALSKATKRIFGTLNWPVEYKTEKAVYYYRMDPKIADWWTSAREAVQR
jgi:hypothetical protein